MPITVYPGSHPVSRISTVDDPTVVGLVVVNPDGSSVGSAAATGAATSANQVLQLAQETASAAVLGTTGGAAVITDANGTVQQYLRGLVKLIVAKITVLLDSTQLATLATSAKQDSLLSGITKVGATTVVGITEVDAYTTGATGNHTVAAGALAIAVNFSSDFTGTVLGATYTSANQGVSFARVAQPGNLLPAVAITRSAGSYDYYVVTPT